MSAMNRFVGGVTLAAGLFGALGFCFWGCGSVNTPAVPDGQPGIDASVDGPPIDSPTDASIDVAIPVVPKFDVGYIDEFSIAWNFAGTGFIGFAAIANTSQRSLNLSKLTIVSVTDDDPTVTSNFTLEMGSETPLAPGEAAGLLGGQATVRIVESGLMTEPRNDESLMFGLSFPNFTMGFIDKVVNIRATIRIDDGEITLPMKVRFVASQVTMVDHASRLSAGDLTTP
jgi:hypothetical protein